jgi:hypothetical protein
LEDADVKMPSAVHKYVAVLIKVNIAAALWFYILVFDHYATDPAIEKVAIYDAICFAHFGDVSLHSPVFVNYLISSYSRHILICHHNIHYLL